MWVEEGREDCVGTLVETRVRQQAGRGRLACLGVSGFGIELSWGGVEQQNKARRGKVIMGLAEKFC